MRFHITATIDVEDPEVLLAASRAHTAAWEATDIDDPAIAEMVPNPAAALAAALIEPLDLEALAVLADETPEGAEWAAVLRAAGGPVELCVTDPAGNVAEFTLGTPTP